MTEVPKIVYDRLRAARPDRALPERAHPDADLLTAFAEQTLSATERDGVFEHLALCGDCREVIALALPAADIAATPIASDAAAGRTTRIPARAERSWPKFGWPSLRWAALAAGVAVVASVLLVRPGKLNQAMLPSAKRLVATTAPPAASGAQIASPSVPSSPMPIAPSPMDQLAASAKSDEAPPKPEMQLSRKLKAGPIPPPPHGAESAMLLADNKKESAKAGRLSAAPSAGAFAFDASSRRGATETVEVAAAPPAETPEPSAGGVLMARSDAPAIEKAKPALQSAEAQSTDADERQKTETAVGSGLAKSQGRNAMSAAKLAPTASQTLSPHNVTWTITRGVLQRSLDSGQSWQDALRPGHSLLCYASRDEDIWTGGEAGTLFHSANHGVTWVQVQPSTKAGQLSSDITHIGVSNPAEIVVSASNNEIWRSADGGKTWEKK
jgi:hypothetical protein